MVQNNDKYSEYVDIISQNAYKGESYFIKFKNDTNIYLGIPILRSNLSQEDPDIFSFNVIEPTEKSGMYQKSIKDIQFLEKR
ncbi:MAG: hypothetical protein Kow0042_12860 [Calditrichia bacterium]